jgi:hypothetical protein
LILDFPGGGFVAMTPEHHEDRLYSWAVSTGRPVLAVDYGKAPECETYSCLSIEIPKVYLTQIPTLLPEMKHLIHIDLWWSHVCGYISKLAKQNFDYSKPGGKIIGMSGRKLSIIISGDSA